jgi:flagellar hook assembly protein FlgD
MPPNVFSMSQNFPNPFGRSITQIQYALPLDQGRQRQYRVELSIYDLQGRLLRQLVEGYQFTGEYTQIWDGRDASGSMLPSGTYFYRLQAGRFRAQKKMVVLE